jgi:hypothetical protein
MKIIGEDPQARKKNLSNPIDRAIKTLLRDPEQIREMQAQEAAITALEKMLDNRYFVIRNAEIEGLEIPIPLILVGPPGVWVMVPVAMRGFYRARGDEWERVGNRQDNYIPMRPNLVERTAMFGKVVQTYLAGRGYEKYKVEPVLIFTDPGVHVETEHPSVRIVLMDALDRFVSSLLKSTPIINWKDSQVLINLLKKGSVFVEEEGGELLEPLKDEFSFVDEKEKRTVKLPEISIPLPPDDRVVKAMKKVPFTSNQLIFLGCLIVINIMILGAFVILIIVLSTGHP